MISILNKYENITYFKTFQNDNFFLIKHEFKIQHIIYNFDYY